MTFVYTNFRCLAAHNMMSLYSVLAGFV